MEVANLGIVLWHTWTVRNRVTQAGERLSIESSVLFLHRLTNELQYAVQDQLSVNVQDMGANRSLSMEWMPPEKADATFFPRIGQAAVGVIARDHAGEPKIMA